MAHTGLNGRVQRLEQAIQVPRHTALVTAAIERVGVRTRARLEAFLAGSAPPVVDAAQAAADSVLLAQWGASTGMSAAWASAADRFRQRIARLGERYAEGGEG
jgi:hypothetical protein